ncbi:MAG TPA: serine/threonine-protein kinase [Terriglobales bacterium]|nr:serine/threonine-protein kinase [Terriglobales bacterium]
MNGRKIGRYEVTGELGKGAMGVVYRAVDPNIGRTVALKTMRVDVHGAEAEEMLRRFRNEARSAGVLSHPNVVVIYDAGEDNGIFYIAMEYIEGTTLAAMLNQRRVLPIDRVVDIGSQICMGLDYAHSRGVVHRDVKPSNVMIMPDGTGKIMDFGIAKAGAGLTHTGEILGTPNYMSPEQVRGRMIDGRSDLFSAGVILYEMVTGEKPFDGQSITTVVYKIVNETPIPPRELDVTIHPALSAVIQKALSKQPDDRYQTGAELARALKNYKNSGLAADGTVQVPAAMAEHANSHTQLASALPAAGVTALGMTAREAGSVGVKAPALDVPIGINPPAPPSARKTIVSAQPAMPLTQVFDSQSLVTATQLAQEDTVRIQIPAYTRHSIDNSEPEPKKGSKVFTVVFTLVALGLGLAGLKQLNLKHQRQAREKEVSAITVPQVEEPANVTTPAPEMAPVTAPVADVPPAVIPGTRELEKTKQDAVKLQAEASRPEAADKPQIAVKETPPPPPVTTGELHLTSTPTGAQVEIDGHSQAKWITPFLTPPLKAGHHSLVFTLNGYKPAEQKVEVVAGKKTTVDATLEQLKASFIIDSSPQGAWIVLDGSPTAQTTPAQLTVDPGQHRIVLLKGGFKRAETLADAGPGQTLNFSTPLHPQNEGAPQTQPQSAQQGKVMNTQAPAAGLAFWKQFYAINGLAPTPETMGMVQLRTRPQGASIAVNGMVLPRRTPFRFPLNPGSYRVTLQADGYKPATRTVEVQKGQTATLDELLEPQ